MATSEPEVVNQALSYLGLDADIQALSAAEPGANERAAYLFYATTRDEVLRDWPWPFARKVATLTLVSGTPNEWGYQFRYPSDAVFIRRVLPYGASTATAGQLETPDTRISYQVGQDSSGRLIWTFMEDAVLEYTARITDVAQFPADFVDALALRLAIKMAPRLAGAVEGGKLALALLPLYAWSLQKARANAANEEAPDEPPESAFIIARG